MSKIIKTQFRTEVVSGIEYNKYPPPSSLIKATEMKRAILLRDEGNIRLSSIEYYQSLEKPELGDQNEGQGTFELNGHAMESGSINEVYIWCSAIPSTNPDILKSLSSNYDTIIRVIEVEEFVNRIRKAAMSKGYDLMPHMGAVIYNRGEEVTKKVLNDQKWHHNVFQKGNEFSHQEEYRVAFCNFTFDKIGLGHLDLELGNCSDIIKIET